MTQQFKLTTNGQAGDLLSLSCPKPISAAAALRYYKGEAGIPALTDARCLLGWSAYDASERASVKIRKLPTSNM